MGSRRYTLISNEPIGPDMAKLVMGPVDEHQLTFKPGQFVNLGIMEGGECVAKRPYSIASSPENAELEFCIKNIGGQFTSRLPGLEPGQEFSVDGPFGPFQYDENKPTAFICGGVGITPAMSAMRFADGKASEKLVVFYCARSLEEMPYHQEIFDIEGRNLHIKVIPTLTREVPKNWRGRAGRFAEKDYLEVLHDLSGYRYMACGPVAMVDAVKEVLEAKGVTGGQAVYEGWKI